MPSRSSMKKSASMKKRSPKRRALISAHYAKQLKKVVSSRRNKLSKLEMIDAILDRAEARLRK